MRYTIGSFEFDIHSLVLKKNEEAVSIRHNEAKLLALLIENADRVLSKEEILSKVWQDKVVSEQAVFQNISHLRSLFGNAAIKTFSKRGYQWQLAIESKTELMPIEEKHSQNNVTTVVPIAPETKPNEARNNKSWLTILVAGFAFIIVTIVWSLNAPEDNDSAIKLAYFPITDANNESRLNLTDNALFDFSELTHISSDKFLTSSELEYPKLAEQHPFILAGRMRSFNQKVYLNFTIKGQFAEWHGELFAENIDALTQKLQQHLELPFIYQFLDTPYSPDFKKSTLSLAHQEFPEDPIILCHLIDIYIETGEYDTAMALAEKFATSARQQENWQQLGNALLYQSRVLTNKDLYKLSSEKLALATTAFEKINDLSRQADVWNAQSWLDHQFDDYPAIKESLLKSAQLAYEANDIGRELHALTYLSIMAHKHKQQEDKYVYLRKAESKMKSYELPIYHFAKIPFHYAIFAKSAQDKEPHLKQVLSHTVLTPNHWVAQSSRKQLVQHYIEQNRLLEAEELTAQLTGENAQNSYLKTLIAQANQDNEGFISSAQRTFEQAQLAGQNTLSLDVALLLVTTPNIKVNYDFYALYIEQNATANWRRENENKLLALN